MRSGALKDLELYLPADDRPGSWVTRLVHGEYERRLVGDLAGCAKNGGALYDVGGHVAFFGCAWLRLGGGRSEIFEPVPDSADRIEETLARNGLAHAARVHRVALGDFDGEAILVHNATDIGLASMSHLEGLGVPKIQRQTTNSRVTVDVRRLDGLAETLGLPEPAVVKIDVEGAEGQVVDGAAALLRRSRPVIFCEMHAIAPAVATTARLTAIGYTATALDGASGMPVFRFDPP